MIQRGGQHGSTLVVAGLLAAVLTACDPPTPATRSVAAVDHGVWDEIVNACVDAEGRIDERLLATRYADALAGYLGQLARVEVGAIADEDTQLAFWINAHNAMALQLLLDEQPRRHLLREAPAFFDLNRYVIAGRRMSLRRIRDRVLREQLGDPRVLAALSCPARWSPPLRQEAYRPEIIDQQLDHQCRRWMADVRCNRLDEDAGILYLAPLLADFAQDLDRLYDNPRGFYAKYAPTAAQRAYVLARPELPICFGDYDWTVCLQPPPRGGSPVAAAGAGIRRQ